MEPIGRLGWIQIDCRAPLRLAAFWGAVFGLEVDHTLGELPHYVGLVKAGLDHPHIYFQRVPEPKTVKNRLHFDILVDDVEPLEDFREYGFRWRVMADPEGNEFCLVYEMTDGMTG